MALRLITEATAEPVTLAEAYLFMRVSTSDTSEDALVNGFLKAARKVAETKCKRSFAAETYRLTLDGFPTGGIKIPMPPLSTASDAVAIAYVNSSGISCTMASSSIVIDRETEPSMLFPSTVSDWPETNDVVNAVTVTYQTATVAASENVKTWIKYRVGTMYEHRSAYAEAKTINELGTDYIDGLLGPDRLPEL